MGYLYILLCHADVLHWSLAPKKSHIRSRSMYSNDKLDEGQLIVTQVTSRIIAISFPDPNTIETVEEMVRQRHGNSAYFVNLTENEYFKESFGGRVSISISLDGHENRKL